MTVENGTVWIRGKNTHIAFVIKDNLLQVNNGLESVNYRITRA